MGFLVARRYALFSLILLISFFGIPKGLPCTYLPFLFQNFFVGLTRNLYHHKVSFRENLHVKHSSVSHLRFLTLHTGSSSSSSGISFLLSSHLDNASAAWCFTSVRWMSSESISSILKCQQASSLEASGGWNVNLSESLSIRAVNGVPLGYSHSSYTNQKTLRHSSWVEFYIHYSLVSE